MTDYPELDDLELWIRQIHIDGYERGKKQHKTPYNYTLPNDEFLREKYNALQALMIRERVDELMMAVNLNLYTSKSVGQANKRLKEHGEKRLEQLSASVKETNK